MQIPFTMRKYLFLISFLSACGLISACGNKTTTKEAKETTSSGHIKIAVDQSLQPVITEELRVFDSSYPNAHIDASFQSETNCFQAFFKDSSVRMIIVMCDLTKEERKLATQNGAKVRSMPIAKGGIAVVTNPQSPDSLMTVGQLKSILNGRFIRKYNVVFDNEQSGSVRFLMDSLIHGGKIPSNIYALKNPDSVLDYVSKNKQAIGIVGAINIFTEVDTGIGVFKPNIKVVALRNDSTLEFYQPYQAYVALDLYPLTWQVYFISHDTWQGLATGFANFLASQRGQLIFKHSRMVPLRVPLNVRQVHLTE